MSLMYTLECMNKQPLTKVLQLGLMAKLSFFATCIVVVALITLLIVHLSQPARSVAEYCKIYSQERARLNNLSNPDYNYSSGIFGVSVNDASQLAYSFGKLERVAPTEIEPNVKALQKVYQKINDDPSQTVPASLSGELIDDSVKSWTLEHCN